MKKMNLYISTQQKNSQQIDLREDETTIADLKSKGQDFISTQQGEELARDFKWDHLIFSTLFILILLK